jgi:hypothetical protein
MSISQLINKQYAFKVIKVIQFQEFLIIKEGGEDLN